MPFHDAISLFHKVPRLGLGMYPTPVEEMPRLRAALGSNAPHLFVMRDDYTGPGFGGNKVRKLEYVFAKVKKDCADTVLTVGNIRSNHARVTAALPSSTASSAVPSGTTAATRASPRPAETWCWA